MHLENANSRLGSRPAVEVRLDKALKRTRVRRATSPAGYSAVCVSVPADAQL